MKRIVSPSFWSDYTFVVKQYFPKFNYFVLIILFACSYPITYIHVLYITFQSFVAYYAFNSNCAKGRVPFSVENQLT